MTFVSVAVPVLKGRLRLHLDKGRPWSVVEHLLLEALVKRPWTAKELGNAACLPRRVVIEALVRLMRAGWVQLAQDAGVVQFSITAHGLAVVDNNELPNASKRITRNVAFVLDSVTGTVFRNREVVLHDARDLDERTDSNRIVRLKEPAGGLSYDPTAVVQTLLEQDEKFVAADPTAEKPSHRFMLVQVSDGKIVDGLPDRQVEQLKDVVLRAAGHAGSGGNAPVVLTPAAVGTTPIYGEHRISFQPTDLILDGQAHRKALGELLSKAVTRVFIHSTFISEDAVLGLLPEFQRAVGRGVRVDVLWGQSEDRAEQATSRTAAARLRQHPRISQLGDAFVIHPFSTGSHAKLLLADAGHDGGFVAVVGSCNWLSSGYTSYEASVVVRDAPVVADVARCFAAMSHSGQWVLSDLTSELARIATVLGRVSGGSAPNATAALVVGAQHNAYVLKARDEATKRIFVTSHRLGPTSGPSVIAPLTASARASAVHPQVYFGRSTGPVRQAAKRQLINEAAKDGVSISPVITPRLHAKMLGWDDDCVLITSLNWLSADPVSPSEPKEVGLWIRAPGVCGQLVANFERVRRTDLRTPS